VTATNIQSGTITATQIATGTITATQIAAGAITSEKILANAIVADKIAANSLSLGKLISNTNYTYGGGNFMYELGTSTTVAGYNGAGIFRAAQTQSFAVGGLSFTDDNFAIAGQSGGNGIGSLAGAFYNSFAAGGNVHRSFALLAGPSRAGFFQNNTAPIIWTEMCSNVVNRAIRTQGDVEVQGNITATGTIIPFTGAHDAVFPGNVTVTPGDIVVDTTVIIRKDVNNTLTHVMISEQANVPALGVYSATHDANYVSPSVGMPSEPVRIGDNTYITETTILNPEFEADLAGNVFIVVNGVGEGLINVIGEAGNIAQGDLIVTSNTPGKGMRQSDDILRSRTVARAREAVTFDTPDQVKQIACIYLCG